MDKPRVYFDSRDVSGNIFCVLAEALKVLNQKGEYETADNLTKQVLNSSCYEEALKHIREHVDAVDLRGKY